MEVQQIAWTVLCVFGDGSHHRKHVSQKVSQCGAATLSLVSEL